MQEGLRSVTDLGLSGDPVELREFRDLRLQESINLALAGLDAKGAVLYFEATKEGYDTAIAANLDGRWSLAWAFHKGHTPGEWSTGAQVKFSWK